MSWKTKLSIKEDLSEDFLSKQVDPNGILVCDVLDSESFLFHKKYTKGAHLRKLKDTKYHQIYWETPYYLKALDKFLGKDEIEGKTILDFGCGDGRFTEYLLKRNAAKVVCVDFDYSTLLSLAEYVNDNNYADRVLIVHSDFDTLPFKGEQFDLVLSIGVLYYLNERYEEALRRLGGLLKEKGKLITSDPELEGFFLRSLFFDSLEDAISTFNTRRFKETKEKTGFSFRVFEEREWIDLFEKTGFQVLDRQGISLFHNFLRVLQLRGNVTEESLEKYEKEIWNIFDYFHLNGKLNKHTVWSIQKV